MVKISDATATKIAIVMHESVRAWQRANSQPPAPAWGRAPKWMKDSSIEAVKWRLVNPDASVSAQHDRWMEEKRRDGWKFGRVKSVAKKTHPMLVPYGKLPEGERRKDALVNAVVDALAAPLR